MDRRVEDGREVEVVAEAEDEAEEKEVEVVALAVTDSTDDAAAATIVVADGSEGGGSLTTCELAYGQKKTKTACSITTSDLSQQSHMLRMKSLPSCSRAIRIWSGSSIVHLFELDS